MATLAGFSDLSAEILQDIHLLSANPNLPLVNRYARNVLTHASPTYIARYFLSIYGSLGYREILPRSLRHRVVDLDVVKEIVRLWDLRRGYDPLENISGNGENEDIGETVCSKGKRGEVEIYSQGIGRCDEQKNRPTRRRDRLTAPPLECAELPRRLFRDPPKSSSTSSSINPLIPYLVSTFHPDINYQQGYPLARSVLNNNRQLIEYLVNNGADPAQRGWMAVQAAIEKRDIETVKLLMGVSVDDLVRRSRENGSCEGGRQEKKLREKLLALREGGTDHLVELAMRKRAHDVVEYLVHEQGGMPSLSKIMAMSDNPSPETSKFENRNRIQPNVSRSPMKKKRKTEDRRTSKTHVIPVYTKIRENKPVFVPSSSQQRQISGDNTSKR